jgi:NTE family protein
MRHAPLLAWLLTVVLAGLPGGCARHNRYDGLYALPAGAIVAMPRPRTTGTPRLGIAFGGGGVRGFMHLGVMRALDEAGIRADVVTGTSVGAVAAALYASGMSYAEIERLALSISEGELADMVLSRQGLLNGRALASWVREVTGHRRIGELPLPLGVTVTDLDRGISLLVVDGDLGEAVQASATVPGTVVPVFSQDATYVDGGLLSVVPVRFARALGADLVIGIDIYCGTPGRPSRHAVDTLLKTLRLQSCKLGEAEANEADILVRPRFEPDSKISFDERASAIEAGYTATLAQIPALRERLRQP